MEGGLLDGFDIRWVRYPGGWVGSYMGHVCSPGVNLADPPCDVWSLALIVDVINTLLLWPYWVNWVSVIFFFPTGGGRFSGHS